MTTSGTVGQTIISTAKVIEHALRRCGLPTSAQSPEIVEIAQSCLFVLLTNFANSPLNLWCVERRLLGYESGRAEYKLPSGTSAVLNVLHCRPDAVLGSVESNILTLETTASVVQVGMQFSALPITDFVIETSLDGVTYTVVKQVSVIADEVNDSSEVYWFALDVRINCAFVRISQGTVSGLYACTSVTELTIEPLNRDSYAGLPNKASQAEQPTGYLFNKLLEPTLVLWPVPLDSTKHMALWVHRQVQDVGRLTQQLAIPARWYDATITHLAFRLSMELPGVDPARIALLQGLADKLTFEAAGEETDSAPIRLQPSIGAYTV